MKYYLFLDESGTNQLKNIDKQFPVFVLCGILCSEYAYTNIKKDLNRIKFKYFNNKKVIFHSSEIRQRENEFKILNDPKKRGEFYNDLNRVCSESNYKIISSLIDKIEYSKIYPSRFDIYEKSLSFIFERVYLLLSKFDCNELIISLESRGKKEDKDLDNYIEKLLKEGTKYIESSQFNSLNIKHKFTPKAYNINGIQLSDLIAYPIARKYLNPEKINSTFECFKHNFKKNYDGNIYGYGLKIFPQKKGWKSNL